MDKGLHNKPSNEMLCDALARNITIFTPGPDCTFGQWYDRHETVFTVQGKNLDDNSKSRLLLGNLNQDAYNKLVSMMLLLKLKDVKFDDLVNKLRSIFGESRSLFQKRYDCLNVERNTTEDFVTYGARVNRLSEEFLIATIKPDEFKSLMFTIGLKSEKETDTRTRMLAILEDETRQMNVNIEKLVSEANRLEAIKKDNAIIQSGSSVYAVQQQSYTHKRGTKSNEKPRTPCW